MEDIKDGEKGRVGREKDQNKIKKDMDRRKVMMVGRGDGRTEGTSRLTTLQLDTATYSDQCLEIFCCINQSNIFILI